MATFCSPIKIGNPVGGGSSALLEKGVANGFVVKFDNAARVIITSGTFEANGKIYTLSADTTHTLTSLAMGLDFHYIYVDDSASTAPTPVFIDSITEPVYDAARLGWYNGDDRMVGTVISAAGASEVYFFDTTDYGGKLIRATLTDFLNNFILALNTNPNGVWQTPSTESDVFVPVNAVEIGVWLQNSDVSANVRVNWLNNEAAAIFTSIFDSAQGTAQFALTIQAFWGPLGVSRQIKIGGVDDDDNNFSAFVLGFSYSR